MPRKNNEESYSVGIYQSAIKLLYPLTLEETYHHVAQEASKLVGGKSASIFIYEEKGLKRVYSSVPKNLQIQPRAKGHAYQSYKTKKTLVVPAGEFAQIHPEAKKRHHQSLVLIPLINRGQSFGVISSSSPQTVSDNKKMVNSLNLFGSIAALAIIKARLYQQLSDAIEHRDLFISIASHEFKTPLTAIQGFSELIYQRALQDQKFPLAWAQQMLSDSHRLNRMVKELFQFNQIRTGQLVYSFHRISLRDVIMQAVEDVRLNHPDYKIVPHYHCQQDEIKADKDKLIQAVTNLLNNAIKHSRFGSKVLLIVHQKPQSFEIRVQDHGTGMTKEVVAHAFDEFYRAPGAKREGLGLGMYLTKNIVEAHRGAIQIHSKPGSGTTVLVNLPLFRTHA